jgi:hypothetical protein
MRKRISEKTITFFQIVAMRDHFEGGNTTCFDYQSLFDFAKG